MGRDQELHWANDSLEVERRLEFVGAEKIGKSTLLKRLAHDRPGQDFNVLVYARCRGRSVTDVGQEIADRLCLSAEPGVKEKWPSATLHQLLLEADGLIQLDDLPRNAEQTEILTGDWFQNCRFLLTSAVPHHALAWHPLTGLDPEDGARVIERSSAATFSDEQRQLAMELSAYLDGHPALLEIVGAALRMSPGHADALPSIVGAADPVQAAGRVLVDGLSDPIDRLVAAVVLILDRTPVPVSLIGDITGIDDADERVARLVAGGYLTTQSPEVVATPALDQLDFDWADTRRLVLEGFARWDRADEVAEGALPPLVLRLAGLIGEDLSTVDWFDVRRWTRAVDASLLLSGAWDAWHLSTSLAMLAAESLDDTESKGFVLHQLGTRALCLGARRDAEQLLIEALEWRNRAGDSEGAELTRRNLEFLEEDFVMVHVYERPLTPIDAFDVELPELAERIAAVGEHLLPRVVTSRALAVPTA